MTVSVWPVNAVTGAPVYSGRVLRQTQSALVGGATSARPLGARSGVRPGTPANTVTATSTVWTCKPHAGVLDTQSAAEAGPYLYAVDANETGAVTAANATNPRKDIVYAQLSDPAESDGSTVPGVTIGYLAGTAAPVPAAPATPARSMVLAEISVPISGGGSPTVTWVAPYAVAAGGIIPMSALPGTVLGTTDARVWVDVAGVLYSGDGVAWTRKAGGSLPHLRLRAAGTRASLAAAAWHDVPIDTTGESSGASVVTVTASPGTLNWYVTVNETGLYNLEGSVSMSGATFAVRITAASLSATLAQTSLGSSTSQTDSLSTTRRITAGTTLKLQVYATAIMSTVADAATTPTYLSITKLSD